MTNLTAANAARLDAILDKKWRFSHGVDTFRDCIAAGKIGKSDQMKVPSVQWDRRKFNRMNSDQQREYQRKLDTMKTIYVLYWAGCPHGSCIEVPKMLFDWFNAQRDDERELTAEDIREAFRAELTPAGEQWVIPGCERNAAPTVRQLDLF
jgi:hypothetical protein